MDEKKEHFSKFIKITGQEKKTTYKNYENKDFYFEFKERDSNKLKLEVFDKIPISTVICLILACFMVTLILMIGLFYTEFSTFLISNPTVFGIILFLDVLVWVLFFIIVIVINKVKSKIYHFDKNTGLFKITRKFLKKGVIKELKISEIEHIGYGRTGSSTRIMTIYLKLKNNKKIKIYDTPKDQEQADLCNKLAEFLGLEVVRRRRDSGKNKLIE